MINVFTREIEFMIAVLDNDLAQDYAKLRDDVVYRLIRSANSTLIVTVGMFSLQMNYSYIAKCINVSAVLHINIQILQCMSNLK